MEMTNYINQLVDGTKNVIICLNLTVIGSSETVCGNTSEYLSYSVSSELPPEFVRKEVVGLC